MNSVNGGRWTYAFQFRDIDFIIGGTAGGRARDCGGTTPDIGCEIGASSKCWRVSFGSNLRKGVTCGVRNANEGDASIVITTDQESVTGERSDLY